MPKTRARGQGRRGGENTPPPAKDVTPETRPVESEADMIEKLAQAERERAQQALSYYYQALAVIRRRYGFDIQPIVTLAAGQVIPDVRLVPVSGWRPLSPPPSPPLSDEDPSSEIEAQTQADEPSGGEED